MTTDAPDLKALEAMALEVVDYLSTKPMARLGHRSRLEQALEWLDVAKRARQLRAQVELQREIDREARDG